MELELQYRRGTEHGRKDNTEVSKQVTRAASLIKRITWRMIVTRKCQNSLLATTVWESIDVPTVYGIISDEKLITGVGEGLGGTEIIQRQNSSMKFSKLKKFKEINNFIKIKSSNFRVPKNPNWNQTAKIYCESKWTQLFLLAADQMIQWVAHKKSNPHLLKCLAQGWMSASWAWREWVLLSQHPQTCLGSQ